MGSCHPNDAIWEMGTTTILFGQIGKYGHLNANKDFFGISTINISYIGNLPSSALATN